MDEIVPLLAETIRNYQFLLIYSSSYRYNGYSFHLNNESKYKIGYVPRYL